MNTRGERVHKPADEPPFAEDVFYTGLVFSSTYRDSTDIEALLKERGIRAIYVKRSRRYLYIAQAEG